MLRRAKRISKYFNLYCEHSERPELKLNKAEWRQIDYLLFITEPFYRFTTVLSKTKDVTVHNVFRVYNALFDHFEKSIDRLTPKSIPWKVAMLNALHAGMKKLSVYYAKTKEIHGSLYAIGTILAPQQKLSFFSSKAWGRSEDDSDWSTYYRNELHDFMKPYAQQISQVHPQQVVNQLQGRCPNLSALEDLLGYGSQHLSEPTSSLDRELNQYLDTREFAYSILLVYHLRTHYLYSKEASQPFTFLERV